MNQGNSATENTDNTNEPNPKQLTVGWTERQAGTGECGRSQSTKRRKRIIKNNGKLTNAGTQVIINP